MIKENNFPFITSVLLKITPYINIINKQLSMCFMILNARQDVNKMKFLQKIASHD